MFGTFIRSALLKFQLHCVVLYNVCKILQKTCKAPNPLLTYQLVMHVLKN